MRNILTVLCVTLFLLSCSDEQNLNSNEKGYTTYNYELKGGVKKYEIFYYANNKIAQVTLKDDIKIIINLSEKEDNYFIFSNDIDQGKGTLVINTNDMEYSQYYEDYNLLSAPERNVFKDCMDEMYNRVCDGFVGCVAWYTNPAVPLAAAVYCQFHLEEFEYISFPEIKEPEIEVIQEINIQLDRKLVDIERDIVRHKELKLELSI